MKKRFVGIFLVFLHWGQVSAQIVQPDSDSISFVNLKLAYNGSILYPGFRTGMEYPVKRVAVVKSRKNGNTRHFDKLRYLSAEIGYYHHPTFHDNVYLLAGWQMRRQHPRGFFTEFSPAIGYSRTFLGGETYLVDNNGQISILKWAGYNYAIIALGGGLGYTFHSTASAYFRTSLLTMFPSNNLVYVRPTAELGLIWHARFWKATWLNNPSKKSKKR